MIWWQSECKLGDMIRISLGQFYHYGIFVSEDEVIQFGLPPVEGLIGRKFEDISVCVSDIYTFSAGSVVEVASVEKSKKEKRLAPKKTVQLAREKIGEKGYDILRNNCEHFARYCYLGEKRCIAAENVVNSWKSKTICDVYFSIIPDEIDYKELQPKDRNDEVLSVSNDKVKKSKYWVWKTLEYALFRSFGYKLQDLDIVKTKSGKWISKKCFFSLSHSKNAVAVIVSNKETGIDIEEVQSFTNKFSDDKTFDSFAKKITSNKENCPTNVMELISLWTKKECLFKFGTDSSFIPNKICTTDKKLSTFAIELGGNEFVGSVVGDDPSIFRFYTFSDESAMRFKEVKWL